MKWRTALPLPQFVMHPFMGLVIAAIHVYLNFGHISRLFGGDVHWTHIWKGFGALAGAHVFAALASRGLARVRVTKVGREEDSTSFLAYRPRQHK